MGQYSWALVEKEYGLGKFQVIYSCAHITLLSNIERRFKVKGILNCMYICQSAVDPLELYGKFLWSIMSVTCNGTLKCIEQTVTVSCCYTAHWRHTGQCCAAMEICSQHGPHTSLHSGTWGRCHWVEGEYLDKYKENSNLYCLKGTGCICHRWGHVSLQNETRG